MKKMIAFMLAAAITTAPLCSISVGAETTAVNYADVAIEDVYAVIAGSDHVILSDSWTTTDLVLDSSGKYHIIEKRFKGAEITVSKGIELPLDEIKKAAYSKYVSRPQIRKNSNGVTYSLSYSQYESRDVIIDILKSYDCVLSIDENYEVWEDTANQAGTMAFFVSYDKSAEEFLSRYPDIGLVHDEENDYMAQREGYDYYFGLKGDGFSFQKLYEPLKDMNLNGIKYDVLWCLTELAYLPNETFNCTRNLYTKNGISEKLRTEIRKFYRTPAVQGDANGDGSLDLADAIYIMQSLANPDKYQLTEQGRFNADMDGDGVTVGDAQAIQDRLLMKYPISDDQDENDYIFPQYEDEKVWPV